MPPMKPSDRCPQTGSMTSIYRKHVEITRLLHVSTLLVRNRVHKQVGFRKRPTFFMKFKLQEFNQFYLDGKNYRPFNLRLLPQLNGKGLAYDLACGRGDASYYLALMGYKV